VGAGKLEDIRGKGCRMGFVPEPLQ
jgi:hypothetical protein